MEEAMAQRRIFELLATVLIGDGVVFLYNPRSHMLIWIDLLDLPVWQRFVRWFADHPNVGRLTGAAELALASWLLARSHEGLEG
jgi:hypothetical protein